MSIEAGGKGSWAHLLGRCSEMRAIIWSPQPATTSASNTSYVSRVSLSRPNRADGIYRRVSASMLGPSPSATCSQLLEGLNGRSMPAPSNWYYHQPSSPKWSHCPFVDERADHYARLQPQSRAAAPSSWASTASITSNRRRDIPHRRKIQISKLSGCHITPVSSTWVLPLRPLPLPLPQTTSKQQISAYHFHQPHTHQD